LETYGPDTYGRTLATIYEMDGQFLINVNEEIVKKGQAWVFRMFYGHLPISRRIQLENLEEWAKSKRVGLWNADNPIPPWDWRKPK
jgi:micrococcal nuclease